MIACNFNFRIHASRSGRKPQHWPKVAMSRSVLMSNRLLGFPATAAGRANMVECDRSSAEKDESKSQGGQS